MDIIESKPSYWQKYVLLVSISKQYDQYQWETKNFSEVTVYRDSTSTIYPIGHNIFTAAVP